MLERTPKQEAVLTVIIEERIKADAEVVLNQEAATKLAGFKQTWSQQVTAVRDKLKLDIAALEA